ncbi:MAG: ketosteroid isomerase [Glaciihabitans sp.]|nr:ketosteroid isomerase [Glaciihabitans sp.]
MEDFLALRRRIERLYAAFNRRDIAEVFDFLFPSVEWADGGQGGFVHGRANVADYWSRQWRAVDPTVTPLAVTTSPDGRVAVDVHQVVRDVSGVVISDTRVQHLYTLDGGLVARMDIEHTGE